MQTAAKSNLTLMSFSSFKRISGIRHQSLNLLAERLVAIADRAYPLRQMDAVEQASDILLALPLPCEFKGIANYYKAYCLKRRGQFDEAQNIFEEVADEATPIYKARAIIALGTLALSRSDVQSATSLYIEAGCAVVRAREFDPIAAFYTQSAFAILKSLDGNHNGALTDLEKMFPLVRAIGSYYPPLYYNFLNSLAVELLEVGQITEAQNVSKIVLASPYVGTYPEYRETSIDIALRGRRASRSVVSFGGFNSNAGNVLSLPLAEHVSGDSPVSTASVSQEPTRVLYMQDWIDKMGKEPDGNQQEGKTLEEMTEREMIYRIVNLITQPGISEQKRLAMLRSVEKIAATPDVKPDEDSDED